VIRGSLNFSGSIMTVMRG